MVIFRIKGVGKKVKPKVNFITVADEILDSNKHKSSIISSYYNLHHKRIIDLFLAQYQQSFCSIDRLDYINKDLIVLINNGTLSYTFINNKFKHEKTYIVKILSNLDKNSKKARSEDIKLNSKIKILTKNSKITFNKIRDRIIRKFPSLSSYEVINLKSIFLEGINLENLKKCYRKIIKYVYFEVI
tara:strand:- start:5271 stop:5828 length:558 start_codon:yes stop_codon:yes gene_type:complete